MAVHGSPPLRRLHFLSCTPSFIAKSTSYRPSLDLDLPAGSLRIAAVLLALASAFFTGTGESFTVVDVQMIIEEYCILLLFVFFLACEIGTYCLEMEQRELD